MIDETEHAVLHDAYHTVIQTAMFTSTVFMSLLALSQACPTYTEHDRTVHNNAIEAANIRRRDYARWHPSIGKNKRTVITNVHIFDGFEYHNQTTTVVIDGSVIGNDTTGAAEVIDGMGGTLMPGLIENHAHPQTLDALKNLSMFGVTTTMGASCHTADLCASLRKQPGLSDFYSPGWAAVVANSSHAQMLSAPPTQWINNTEECSNWVRGRLDTGSDYIKLIAETNGPTMTLDEHIAMTNASHNLGLKTWTHASTVNTYDTAIRSKTDFIQHSPADLLLNSTCMDQILSNKQFVTPTAVTYQFAEQVYHVNSTTGDRMRRVVPLNVKAMYDAGIPLLAGTDATGNFIEFGDSLHAELELMVEAGVPNLDALKAATSRAAFAYGMNDRGVVTTGKRADLLLVQGNPLVNISDTRKIQKVWFAGLELDRSQSQ